MVFWADFSSFLLVFWHFLIPKIFFWKWQIYKNLRKNCRKIQWKSENVIIDLRFFFSFFFSLFLSFVCSFFYHQFYLLLFHLPLEHISSTIFFFFYHSLLPSFYSTLFLTLVFFFCNFVLTWSISFSFCLVILNSSFFLRVCISPPFPEIYSPSLKSPFDESMNQMFSECTAFYL